MWWLAPSESGVPITLYTVSCSSSDGGTYVRRQHTSTVLTLNSLTPRKTYRCSVSATNVLGDGPAATSLPFIPVGLPSAPTFAGGQGLTLDTVTVLGSPKTINKGLGTLVWTAGDDDGGRPIEGYKVKCDVVGVGFGRSNDLALTSGYTCVGSVCTSQIAQWGDLLACNSGTILALCVLPAPWYTCTVAAVTVLGVGPASLPSTQQMLEVECQGGINALCS